MESSLSINCMPPFSGSNFLHNWIAKINCNPVNAAEVYLMISSLSLSMNTTTIAQVLAARLVNLDIFHIYVSYTLFVKMPE